MWEGRVSLKLHHWLIDLQITKPFIHIAYTLSTCTWRKWTVILQLIPEHFQLSKEINHRNFTLMELCNFLLKIVNSWSIALSKSIPQINPDLQSRVFIKDAWSFGETKLVSQVPTMLSHLIQAWIVEGVDTNGDDKVRESSINANLFLVSKAFLTARAHAK